MNSKIESATATESIAYTLFVNNTTFLVIFVTLAFWILPRFLDGWFEEGDNTGSLLNYMFSVGVPSSLLYIGVTRD